MTGIAKRFGAVRAIRSADLTMHVGRVLALVGENGAGKSTLIKILSGAVTADSGTITYDGRPVTIHSTSDAMGLGIATVYQEPQLFSELTVSENIFMGREIRKGGRIDWAAQTAKVVELLGLLDLPARYATAVVGDLSIAEQQQVSIAKALASDANILILDEPSAILTDAEIEVLFGVVRRLTESGVSVIYISHRLDELFRIAQDVLVMRDGRTIGTYPIEELSVRKVVELMVGGILTETKHEREIDPKTEPRLELEGLGRRGEYDDVNVMVRPGEIVGSLRPGRLGCLRDRRLHLRHRARRLRPDPAGRAPDPAPLAAARAALGHRAAAGEPQAAGNVLLPVDHVQHLGRAPHAAEQAPRLGRSCPGTPGGPGHDQASRGEDAEREPADRSDVGRQRTKGRAGPAAGRTAPAAGAGRADAGGRRRRQGGDPPHHQ